MVVVATGGIGTRAIRNVYPVSEGLTLGTTKLKDNFKLRPTESSKASEKDKVGL